MSYGQPRILISSHYGCPTFIILSVLQVRVPDAGYPAGDGEAAAARERDPQPPPRLLRNGPHRGREGARQEVGTHIMVYKGSPIRKG